MLYEIDQKVRVTKDGETFDGVLTRVLSPGAYLVGNEVYDESELEDLDSVLEWEEFQSEKAMERCKN